MSTITTSGGLAGFLLALVNVGSDQFVGFSGNAIIGITLDGLTRVIATPHELTQVHGGMVALSGN